MCNLHTDAPSNCLAKFNFLKGESKGGGEDILRDFNRDDKKFRPQYRAPVVHINILLSPVLIKTLLEKSYLIFLHFASIIQRCCN